jgi:hypothetical protein
MGCAVFTPQWRSYSLAPAPSTFKSPLAPVETSYHSRGATEFLARERCHTAVSDSLVHYVYRRLAAQLPERLGILEVLRKENIKNYVNLWLCHLSCLID